MFCWLYRSVNTHGQPNISAGQSILADGAPFGDLTRMIEKPDPDADYVRMRLRLYFGDDLMLGPGKADLLELIASHGSIAAAGRAMKMSYKRAWMLVEEMNNAFRDPLVESTRGGSHGGGARVTETGAQILAHYRNLEEQAAVMGAPEIEAIRALLKAR